MTAKVVRQKAIPGFLPTTYSVFVGNKLIKVFVSKIDAEMCAKNMNDRGEIEAEG